ncbi:SPRY-domain-containing protein [Panus rudis PR-1116 ss-1]|nr:SPRY-domain-containing protein [Panus rudis PR-1116 ss-1]
MTSRPSRSASIPIPGARNIETAIAMPFPNSNTYLGPRISPASSRMHASPGGASSSGSIPRTNIATSPVRSLSTGGGVSGSYSSIVARPIVGLGNNSNNQPVFEPRIIRAPTSPGGSSDPACVPAAPTPPPFSAARTRRPSATRHSTGVASSPSVHRVPPPSIVPTATQITPQTFPRPAYLEHSSLRALIHTVPPTANPIPAARVHDATPARTGAHITARTPSPSYPYVRRAVSPAMDSDDDSVASVPPPPPPPAISNILPGTADILDDVTMLLPTRWSEQDRHPSLNLSSDGRELTFGGPSCVGEKDSAAARANQPIPAACGIYYYEVEILHKGSKGHISIGFAAGDVRLSRLPGWEKHSWGYHADDGWAFSGQGQKEGQTYGPVFDTGDIIGCGIDFTQHRLFYTKNGTFLGMVFDNVGKGLSLFPSVGLRHSGESIRVNFGQAPFKYAIEDHVHTQRNRVWAQIQSTRIDWSLLRGGAKSEPVPEPEVPSGSGSGTGAAGAGAGVGGGTGIRAVGEEKAQAQEIEEAKEPLRRLVYQYLAHHGFLKTAQAFKAQCDGKLPSSSTSHSSEDKGRDRSEDRADEDQDDDEHDMDTDDAPGSAEPSTRSSTVTITETEEQDLRRRVGIVNAVMKGDVDTALNQTQTYYPTVFEREQGLMLFKLRCRKFVELILEASEAVKRVKAEQPSREREKERESQRGRGREEGSVALASSRRDGSVGVVEMDGEGAMDVDDPSPEALAHSSNSTHHTFTDGLIGHGHNNGQSTIHPQTQRRLAVSRSPSASSSSSRTQTQRHSSPSAALAKTALHNAIQYGQKLEADYKHDARPEVRAHLKRTFGVVAYPDPLAVGGEVAEIAGQEARTRLATELNQAILESQGKPAHPALETLYRQAGACVMQLGLLGVGKAAFADMSKEFLES